MSELYQQKKNLWFWTPLRTLGLATTDSRNKTALHNPTLSPLCSCVLLRLVSFPLSLASQLQLGSVCMHDRAMRSPGDEAHSKCLFRGFGKRWQKLRKTHPFSSFRASCFCWNRIWNVSLISVKMKAFAPLVERVHVCNTELYREERLYGSSMCVCKPAVIHD